MIVRLEAKGNGFVWYGAPDISGFCLRSTFPRYRRLKDDIRPLPTGQLAKMMQLQPVSFVMKNDPKHQTELGLIAQDTEPLFPDLVQTDPDGTKALGYVGLVAPLIKAMQEQQAEIQEQRAEMRAGLALVFCIALVPGFLLWRNRAK